MERFTQGDELHKRDDSKRMKKGRVDGNERVGAESMKQTELDG